jgi:lipopolysaccharide/colanic/teichoic acid biosynthesis glycosyltransferase
MISAGTITFPETRSQLRPAPPARPTVWGLRPAQIHDRFWAARGVQVVRQGEPSEIVEGAELFLLIDRRSLLIFKLRDLVETLSWVKPQALFLRLRDGREKGYREIALTDGEGQFRGFRRLYGGGDPRLARAALTPNRGIAQRWQAAGNSRGAWRELRRTIRRNDRRTASITGMVFDSAADGEVMDFLRELVQCWRHPKATVGRIRRVGANVWSDPDAEVDPAARFVGPVWVGAKRRVTGATSVVGPAVLWDDPTAELAPEEVRWGELEPTEAVAPVESFAPFEAFARPVLPKRRSWAGHASKRAFDIACALLALAVTIPLVYPWVMLAIWLEDRGPFFFAHRRETLGGRQFPCIKFRSMRLDADWIKAQLARQNQADGPQFFMKEDPRISRVGRLIRKTNIDELPQFINVLLGHMSVVGPRPSPRAENQLCPPWREARLSVRPGITGLWQVCRTREAGKDFQEWIRYDIEYVESQSWKLDLWILWKTALLFVPWAKRGQTPPAG